MRSTDPAWDQWFDVQYDLCKEVDHLVDNASKGKSDGFAVALHSSVIEHLAERMRLKIDLPSPTTETDNGRTEPRRRRADPEES